MPAPAPAEPAGEPAARRNSGGAARMMAAAEPGAWQAGDRDCLYMDGAGHVQ
jgi:hypothetical protein